MYGDGKQNQGLEGDKLQYNLTEKCSVYLHELMIFNIYLHTELNLKTTAE